MRPKPFRLFSRAAATLLLALFTTATAWADTVETYYVDADRTRHDVTATVFTGGETTLGTNGQTSWYVVNSDVSAKISCYGNVHLILADGKTLTAHNSDNNNGNAIWGVAGSTLTIYGQTLGTGVLNANTAATNTILFNGDVFIHGGIVNVSSQVGSAISVMNITINGGIVTATGSSYGINATGTITLGGGTVTSNGGYRGTVTVALPDFYIYSDGNGHYYSGTLSDEQKAAIVHSGTDPIV